MTDARSRLRHLDRLDTPDVWLLATTFDPRPEKDEAASGHRSSKRSIAGIVAFAVFIAAGAFAWQAFRPVTRPGTALGPIEGTILWPERTTATLAATQSLADSHDPSVAWRLDPGEIATRFAEDVLGWGAPQTGYVVSVADEEAGAATVTLTRTPPPCPSPLPGATSTCPLPFAEERLTLRQAGTTGEAGVWSVTSVRASGLDLELDPGDVIRNDGTIQARWQLPAVAGDAVEGFAVSTGYEMGPGYPCEGGGREGPIRSDGSTRIAVYTSPGALAGTDCGPSPASYVWIATSVIPRGQGSATGMFLPVPFPQGSQTPTTPTTVRFYGLTVVPMLISLPETAPTSPSETASSEAG
jgi:hypothetical protein